MHIQKAVGNMQISSKYAQKHFRIVKKKVRFTTFSEVLMDAFTVCGTFTDRSQ